MSTTITTTCTSSSSSSSSSSSTTTITIREVEFAIRTGGEQGPFEMGRRATTDVTSEHSNGVALVPAQG